MTSDDDIVTRRLLGLMGNVHCISVERGRLSATDWMTASLVASDEYAENQQKSGLAALNAVYLRKVLDDPKWVIMAIRCSVRAVQEVADVVAQAPHVFEAAVSAALRETQSGYPARMAQSKDLAERELSAWQFMMRVYRLDMEEFEEDMLRIINSGKYTPYAVASFFTEVVNASVLTARSVCSVVSDPMMHALLEREARDTRMPASVSGLFSQKQFMSDVTTASKAHIMLPSVLSVSASSTAGGGAGNGIPPGDRVKPQPTQGAKDLKLLKKKILDKGGLKQGMNRKSICSTFALHGRCTNPVANALYGCGTATRPYRHVCACGGPHGFFQCTSIWRRANAQGGGGRGRRQ